VKCLKGFLVILFSLLLIMYAEVIAYADTASHQPHSYSSAIKISAPSVVSVYINSDPAGPARNHSKHANSAFGYRGPATLGSAVIINKEGYLLTNYHVIRHAQRIIIVTADGRHSAGTVVGYDKATDLAVLKIRLSNLSSARLGNSDRADVGDIVFAIGNAFGLGQSVTQGIISAIRRHAVGSNALKRFIQTDVAMNPGNSGGPLINSKGEVIGINSSIYSHSGGYQGISFSIPINLALNVMQKIIKNGRVDRGWLG
jgi:serine protease DegS